MIASPDTDPVCAAAQIRQKALLDELTYEFRQRLEAAGFGLLLIYAAVDAPCVNDGTYSHSYRAMLGAQNVAHEELSAIKLGLDEISRTATA